MHTTIPRRTRNVRRKQGKPGRTPLPAISKVLFKPFTGTAAATALALSRSVPAAPKSKPEHKPSRFERALLWFATVRNLLRLVRRRLAIWGAAAAPILSDSEWCAFPLQPGKGERHAQQKPVGYRALGSTGQVLA